MGATCAESPVPSVASEELATGKRWTSLALVMQVLRAILHQLFMQVFCYINCSLEIFQIFPTFLVAGLGMVAAGLVLNLVQAWPVFTQVISLSL